MQLIATHPPQWGHRRWTVTMDPTSSSAAPRYWLTAPDGSDSGYCASLCDARAEIDATCRAQ